eukprot:c22095_g1_i1 orf=464-1876(+)
MLVALLIVLLTIAGAPSILSSQSGLHTVVSLTNKLIPGHVKVQSLSVGWNKHITLQGVSLEGVDGDVVLSIPKLETNSSLLSIVRGKAGLGDCTVTSPTFDLREDKVIGLSKLALAIVPPHMLLKYDHRVKVSTAHGKKKKKLQPAVNVMLSATIKASGGDLQVVDGNLIMPNDIATVLGKRILLDVLLGEWATQENEELKESCKTKMNVIPLKVGMWSDCTEAEAIGFLNLKKMEINLIKPMKVEMDLNPEVGQLYLAQVNPLLGEIVGPSVQDEDMPDVIMYISPENLMLPAELYNIRFEPMKAILARGPLVGGVLNLLSSGKKDIAQGRKDVTLQTSHIEANIGLDGHVNCSRIDFLIAGKVHIAIWGLANWIDETVKMTLAIPGTTLTNVLGQFNLPKIDYHLKIPISGTFEHPEVNWKSASIGLAQLALYQRGPGFMRDFLMFLDSNEEPVPESSEKLPWNSEIS